MANISALGIGSGVLNSDLVDQLVRELQARNTLAAVVGSVSEQGSMPIEVAP